MKKIFILSFFALLMQTQVVAQTQPVCDTLVLLNGKILSVRIDSVSGGKVYCKDCPGDYSRQHKLELAFVKSGFKTGIQAGSSDQKINLADLEKKLKINPVKKWIFKRKAKKVMRSVSEGQGIKVKYRYKAGSIDTRTVKGTLKNISKDQLIMETKTGEMKIDHNKVEVLGIYKSKGTAERVVGGLAIGAGLAIVLGLSVLVLVIGLLALFNTPADEEKELLNGGCLLGALLLIGGIAFIASAGAKTVDEPFGGDWEISEAYGKTEGGVVEDEIYKDHP